MKSSIPNHKKQVILEQLSSANKAFQEIYPGEKPDRQPVHTVYGGAHLFKSNTVPKMGEVAIKTFREHIDNFVELSKLLDFEDANQLPDKQEDVKGLEDRLAGLSPELRQKEVGQLSYDVYNKIIKKLEREAVEDFRIDFEDGYGNRPNEEEDQTAENAALEVAKGFRDETLSPFIGIRVKPFTEDLKERGIRTLDIFLTTLLEQIGQLPNNFIVMLPKVTIPEQVRAMVDLFEIIEKETGLPNGSLKMEIMVETTQSIMDSDGKNSLKSLVDASEGRCIATHFGTYDYTASCNITAKYQDMDHPVCDFAHHMTKVALGGTGIWLSDGATNIMPIGPHRGENLSDNQRAENKEVVHRAWKTGYKHIRHSLWNGFYQGWDLHPAQLPMRYAAVYSFFLESYSDAAIRLKNFMDSSAKAILSGDIFDDAATGQGLLNYFLKALNSGAISIDEISTTGLTLEEIRGRSFVNILASRRN